MSAFLHQIFYANNKFDDDSTDDRYAFVEELSKWSAPITFDGKPSHVIPRLSGDGLPSKDNTDKSGVLEKEKPHDFARTPALRSSVGVRGFACEAGVSGWRPKTPTGLSGDGLPLKDNAYENKLSSALSFEDKSSPDNHSSPSFVPHSGLVVNPRTPTQVVPPCSYFGIGVLTKHKTSHSLFDKPVRPVHPRIPSNLSIFQSVFLLHYGYSEYIMAENRMLNRELEEKQKIMETLSKTPKKLKEGNHKLTNDNIQEILSGLLVATKEEIMHLVAYSAYYNRIIYLVFTHSYLIFSPTKETAVDSTNILSVYILNQTRKHPKYGGSYYPEFNPTLEKMENIHNSKIHLEHYAKPFKGVSAYKLPELEEMATKTGMFENGVPAKYKKKELYDKIVEVCCAGICA
jgi:cell division protein FtsB